jgi:hypothetical protein
MPFSVTLCVPGPALALLSQRIAEKIEAEKAGGSAASASCDRYRRTWAATSGGTLGLASACAK